MKTRQVYYEDPYRKELESTVLSVSDSGGLSNVILDQTIFYPEGGGQPSDRGVLGDAKVEQVRFMDGEIVHQVRGELQPGLKVMAQLDWGWRHKYMKIHTAGHLLHDVMMTLYPSLTPIRGSHGKKAFLEYNGTLDASQKDTIEQKVNETAQQDLPVVTKEASYEEIQQQCQFVPENLPRNKSLRMIKIGDFYGMPDGGVHVKSTKEIGTIWIANITTENNITRIRYGVAETS